MPRLLNMQLPRAGCCSDAFTIEACLPSLQRPQRSQRSQGHKPAPAPWARKRNYNIHSFFEQSASPCFVTAGPQQFQPEIVILWFLTCLAAGTAPLDGLLELAPDVRFECPSNQAPLKALCSSSLRWFIWEAAMKDIASHEDLISRLSKRSTERAAITSLRFLQRTVWISVHQSTWVCTFMQSYVYI